MAAKHSHSSILFVINPTSGAGQVDFEKLIRDGCIAATNKEPELYMLGATIDQQQLKKTISDSQAKRIVAVGGDGTIKLVAECIIKTDRSLGIIPAGSANGMAKELGIPLDFEGAFDLCMNGKPKKIHVVQIGNEICIHLADLGFNAYLVKEFEAMSSRGMFGYFRATFHALKRHRKMRIELTCKGEKIESDAAMVAIGNATTYGSGLKINPDGRLDDKLFEVILVKDYSYFEIFKVWIGKGRFNPKKVEVFQTDSLKINSKHSEHFQIDGEYLGKVKHVSATIIPAALNIITTTISGETES